MKTTLAVALAASALALTACTDPAAGPTVTETVTTTPEPAVTVTVTETPAPAPDYGFTFFHGAQMGATWAQMSAQLHMPVGGADGCPWYGAVWSTDLAYTYAFTDSRDTSSGVTFFYTDKFLAPGGADFPRNAEGIGVGSRRADVLAAYPSAVVGGVDDLGAGHIDTITVNDPDSSSKYVFGFTGGSRVSLLQWGPGAGTQWSHLCTGF